MTSFSQDPANNDLVIEDGSFVLAGDKDACAHIIADVVRTLEGELQLDTEAGIPYERTIWSSIKNIPLWRHYVTQAITKLPFVSEITSFTTELISGNILSYELNITLTTDETVTVRQ